MFGPPWVPAQVILNNHLPSSVIYLQYYKSYIFQKEMKRGKSAHKFYLYYLKMIKQKSKFSLSWLKK